MTVTISDCILVMFRTEMTFSCFFCALWKQTVAATYVCRVFLKICNTVEHWNNGRFLGPTI